MINMRTPRRFGVALLLLLPAGLYGQATTYTYTGNPFTNAMLPWTTSNSISGHFTTPVPLGPSSGIQANWESNPLTNQILNFSFTDGVNTYSNNLSNPGLFWFIEANTDAHGNITSWFVKIGIIGGFAAGDYLVTCNGFGDCGIFADALPPVLPAPSVSDTAQIITVSSGGGQVSVPGFGQNQFDSGTWTQGASCNLKVVIKPFASGPNSFDGKPTSMNAIFAPLDANGLPESLDAAADDCQFEDFNWEQTVTSVAASLWVPADLSAVDPKNLAPDNTLIAPPAFIDPPRGGYAQPDLPEAPSTFPFLWSANDFDNLLPCTKDFPIRTDNQLRFQDCPANLINFPFAAPTTSFTTSLVGVVGSGVASMPLFTWKWQSNFSGKLFGINGKGGVFGQTKSFSPVDSNSGTGGITITEINGVPQTPPATTCTATPSILWPPNGKPVDVTVSGSVTAGTSPLSFASYLVRDEYGQDQPSGSFTIDAAGNYSFTVALIAARDGNDLDGRTYTFVVSAGDRIGNVGSCTAVVTVPHDQGN
ncbi:MAG TPA: hypothetical protein VI636_18395 [Candidatus Angelobacter sp.]